MYIQAYARTSNSTAVVDCADSAPRDLTIYSDVSNVDYKCSTTTTTTIGEAPIELQYQQERASPSQKVPLHR